MFIDIHVLVLLNLPFDIRHGVKFLSTLQVENYYFINNYTYVFIIKTYINALIIRNILSKLYVYASLF